MKITPGKPSPAFTRIELLAGVAITSVLASLLFAIQARPLTPRAKSIHNQQQIGMAYQAYAQDHHGWYPEVQGLAATGGKEGKFIEMARHSRGFKPDHDGGVFPKKQLERMARVDLAEVARIYGATTPPRERPLNPYLKDPKVFHDPADNGGTAYNLKSCWEAFGNSYQPAVADDFFRVQHVLGERAEDNGTPFNGKPADFSHTATSEKDDPPEGRSLRQAQVTSPANKIIQGDWNWPYDKADTWHGKKDEAGHVMLFADGHADYFVFPPTELLMLWISPPHKVDAKGKNLVNNQKFYIYDDQKFRATLAKPKPKLAEKFKRLQLNPAQYQTIKGRPAKYIDPDFLWW